MTPLRGNHKRIITGKKIENKPVEKYNNKHPSMGVKGAREIPKTPTMKSVKFTMI